MLEVGGLGLGIQAEDASSTYRLPALKRPEDAECKLSYADKDVVNLDRDYVQPLGDLWLPDNLAKPRGSGPAQKVVCAYSDRRKPTRWPLTSWERSCWVQWPQPGMTMTLRRPGTLARIASRELKR